DRGRQIVGSGSIMTRPPIMRIFDIAKWMRITYFKYSSFCVELKGSLIDHYSSVSGMNEDRPRPEPASTRGLWPTHPTVLLPRKRPSGLGAPRPPARAEPRPGPGGLPPGVMPAALPGEAERAAYRRATDHRGTLRDGRRE